MRLKNLDLILVLGIVVANLLWTFWPVHPGVIGIVLSLPLIFGLPGYVMTEAFFRPQALEPLQRLLFSLALSLAVTILCGFGLNLLPGGLTSLSWVVILCGLCAFFSLFAYLRRRGTIGERRARTFRLTIPNLLLLGLAAGIAVLSMVYSTAGVAQSRLPGFTQLWILPEHGAATNGCVVSIGIHNFEATTRTYHLIVTDNQLEINNISGVSLGSQRQWQQSISIHPHPGANLIEVRLYRQDQPAIVYRNVHLTLKISTSGNSSLCTY